MEHLRYGLYSVYKRSLQTSQQRQRQQRYYNNKGMHNITVKNMIKTADKADLLLQLIQPVLCLQLLRYIR